MAVSLYPERLESVIALFEMVAGIGMMIGPVVAGLLYDYVGFSWIFYGMGIIFLSILPGAFTIQEPDRFDMEQEVEVNVFTMCTYKEILLDAGAVAYVIMCLGIMETYVSTHLIELGLSIEEVGLAFATDPAVYTVCCYVYGKVLKTMNMRRVIQVGILLGVLSSLLMGPPYPLPASGVSVVLGMTVMGAAIASTYVPALPHMIAAAESLGFYVDDRLNDALSSVASGSFSLGEMLGPVLGGIALHYMDFRNLVTLMGGVGLIYLLFHFLLYRRDVRLTLEMRHSLTFYKHIHASLFV
jgi:MFS family permease